MGDRPNAQLAFPTDIAFAQDGSFYIFDAQSARVRKVAPNGVITTVAGNGQPVVTQPAAAATTARRHRQSWA
ncbi:MAG: hypothetical protein U0X75_08115 [Acidobacteriota bacterium]